uniref:(northern house mosquito) hypothetical protein n=1 Tax=Culex pipiens TaxID=7175 RepID=A0A8D8NG15_CULPI
MWPRAANRKCVGLGHCHEADRGGMSESAGAHRRISAGQAETPSPGVASIRSAQREPDQSIPRIHRAPGCGLLLLEGDAVASSEGIRSQLAVCPELPDPVQCGLLQQGIPRGNALLFVHRAAAAGLRVHSQTHQQNLVLHHELDARRSVAPTAAGSPTRKGPDPPGQTGSPDRFPHGLAGRWRGHQFACPPGHLRAHPAAQSDLPEHLRKAVLHVRARDLPRQVQGTPLLSGGHLSQLQSPAGGPGGGLCQAVGAACPDCTSAGHCDHSALYRKSDHATSGAEAAHLSSEWRGSFPGPVHHGRARPEQVERAGQLAVGGGDAAVARAALGRHRRPLHLEPLPERRVGSGVGAGD